MNTICSAASILFTAVIFTCGTWKSLIIQFEWKIHFFLGDSSILCNLIIRLCNSLFSISAIGSDHKKARWLIHMENAEEPGICSQRDTRKPVSYISNVQVYMFLSLIMYSLYIILTNQMFSQNTYLSLIIIKYKHW